MTFMVTLTITFYLVTVVIVMVNVPNDLVMTVIVTTKCEIDIGLCTRKHLSLMMILSTQITTYKVH